MAVFSRFYRLFSAYVWLLIPAATFIPMSFFRLVDGDEGYYALAGRLTANGWLPYADFFYPQAPCLPYILGFFIRIIGPSWYGLRLFNAAAAVVTAAILYNYFRARFDARLAWSGLLLFSVSNFALPWLVVIKTYSLTLLLMILAFVLVSSKRRRLTPALLAGLCLGLATGIRLYVWVMLPLYCLWLLFQERRDSTLRATGFAGGAVVGMLPLLIHYYFLPREFWFDNIGYHSFRSYSALSLSGLLQIKLDNLLWLLGGSLGHSNLEGLEILLFGVPTAWLTFSCLKARSAPPLAALSAMVLSLASFVPTPVYAQYFCLVVPFLIISTIAALARLRIERNVLPGRGQTFLVAVWAIATVSILFYCYALSGKQVPGVPTSGETEDWRISAITKVSRSIDRFAGFQEKIFSWWPGYFLEAASLPLPGMENHFAIEEWRALHAVDRRLLKLTSEDEIMAMIAACEPRILVLGIWTPLWLRRQHLTSCYNQVDQIGGVKVLLRNPEQADR